MKSSLVQRETFSLQCTNLPLYSQARPEHLGPVDFTETLIGQAKIKCLRQGSALWPESEGWEWILGRPKHGCHWPWQQKPELASWLQGTRTACHGPTTHSAASASLPCRFLSQNCHPSSLPEPLFRLLILQGLTPLHLPLLKLSPATQVFIRHLLPTTSDPLVLTVLRSVFF